MLGRASSTVQPVQAKHLSRGKITDRPWGQTLGALAAAAHSGQLAITTADRKTFRLVLVNGLLADASSPVSADSLARVALALRMIPAPHAAEIHKRTTREPGRDELAIAAEVTGLRPDELARLRRQAILQRAARTFSLEAGAYRFDQGAGHSATIEIDLAEVIYTGARQHLDANRMATDLRLFGARFVMDPGARPLLTRFGFSQLELPIVRALERGTSVAELDAGQHDLDPRVARAAIYALASCGVITRSDGAHAPRAATPAIAQPRTTTEDLAERPAGPRAPQGMSRAEIETMIADRCSLIDAGRDLFAVLGLELGASIEAVHSAFLELAAYIQPDRLAAAGIPESADAQRLLARATVACATLTEPVHRACYLEKHAAPEPRGSTRAIEIDRAPLAHEAAVHATRLMAANRPGAAVAELARACELAPRDADYRAMLAWAAFCAAPSKPQLEHVTRRSLLGALDDARHPEMVRTYLGRMERMLGHDLEALQHFRAVLALMPDHPEAAIEARVIEARIARGTGRVL